LHCQLVIKSMGTPRGRYLSMGGGVYLSWGELGLRHDSWEADYKSHWSVLDNQIVSWILPVWIAVDPACVWLWLWIDPACVWLWLWIDPACVCRLLCLSASGLLNILCTKLEDQWTRDWVDHHTWSIKPPFFLCLVVNITYIWD